LIARGGFGAGCAPKGLWLLGVLGERDVRSACAVAVDNRGEPLHVGAEDLCECLALGLAQLREFLGDVRDRTVMLT
jgi:hypothetical protein